MSGNNVNKSSSQFILIFMMIVFTLFYACDVVTIEINPPPQVTVHPKDKKPDTPVALGTIRGYFGNYYKTFDQQIEKVQPVDSFSNIYFYGGCENDNINQVNLIRADSNNVLAIFINGYALDSLPDTFPFPSGFGKFIEIQYHPNYGFNYGTPGHFLYHCHYGQSFLITDKTDDILTGTFEGTMNSAEGRIMPITEGEFKIKIFRRKEPCWQDTAK